MSSKPKKILLFTAIILLLIFAIFKIKRFFEIDSCLDKGGRWNYELKKCETLDLSDINLRWYADYDTITKCDLIVKGNLVDVTGISTYHMIKALNNRNAKCKIELLDFNNDTIHIKILNDEYLTEQMGSSGAYWYLGETVFSLTEYGYDYVKIDMNEGSHATPGIYHRSDFNYLVIINNSQVFIKSYSTGQSIDSSWTILGEDLESYYKTLQNKSDSLLSCATIADTIISISKSFSDEKEAIMNRTIISNILKKEYDSTYRSSISDIWESYQFSWNDNKSGDFILISKTKPIKKHNEFTWSLEITNEKLSDSLSKRHDPFYSLTKDNRQLKMNNAR